MVRSNCINTVSSRRCGKQIRARVSHKLCRACYYLVHKTARPIGRVTKERVVKTKFVPTVEVTTRKRKK